MLNTYRKYIEYFFSKDMEKIFQCFEINLSKEFSITTDVSLQFLGHTECLVAGKHSHDGNRRSYRGDRRPDPFGGSVIIPPTYS